MEVAGTLHEIKGDLFTAPRNTDHLACAISQDIVMSKGIAKEFGDRFNGLERLKYQNKKVGEVASLRKVSMYDPEGGRFVYYLVIKEKYCDKPRLEDVKAALTMLRDEAKGDKVRVISMARIGCGVDGLDWGCVRQLIIDTFDGSGIKINVYSL